MVAAATRAVAAARPAALSQRHIRVQYVARGSLKQRVLRFTSPIGCGSWSVCLSVCLWHADLAVVRERARACRRRITTVDRFFYAMKANNNVDVLRTIVDEGFGIECVSSAEVRRSACMPC